jgi:KUP system potassium uptake protein
VYPMVVLATAAGVIASQALISGAFSITMQAIQLGYLPRMEIQHTSSAEKGQVYLPTINWILLACCIFLVLEFQNSSRLSAAYGIAVSLTMLITSVIFYFAARRLWAWNRFVTILLCGAFVAVETIFFASNALKIMHGGWFPLLVAVIIFTIMTTWKRGRHLLRERLAASMLPFDDFLDSVRAEKPIRVKGTAVFMAGNPKGTPLALLHNLKHNQVLHSRVIVLTLATAEQPHVRRDHRVEVEALPEGFYRVIARFGFMETPSVREAFEACRNQGLDIAFDKATYFLSRETIIATPGPGMAVWRERLFGLLARNAQTATSFFGLPENRVVELGMQVRF